MKTWMPGIKPGMTMKRAAITPTGPACMTNKVDVRSEWWDNIFAPSSCLVIITTADKDGRVNAARLRDPHPRLPLTRCTSPSPAERQGHPRQRAGDPRVRGQRGAVRATMLDKTLICGLPFRGGENELIKAGLTPIPSRSSSRRASPSATVTSNARSTGRQAWLHRLMVCGKVEAVSIDEDCITTNGHIVGTRSSRRTIAACATRTASCRPTISRPAGSGATTVAMRNSGPAKTGATPIAARTSHMSDIAAETAAPRSPWGALGHAGLGHSRLRPVGHRGLCRRADLAARCHHGWHRHAEGRHADLHHHRCVGGGAGRHAGAGGKTRGLARWRIFGLVRPATRPPLIAIAILIVFLPGYDG